MIVCETPTPNIEMCHRQMAAHAEAEQTKQKKSIDHQLVSSFYYAENICSPPVVVLAQELPTGWKNKK